MNTSSTQARIFATEYAKDSAQEMLNTIKEVASKAGLVTRIVLAVSMPHQIGYILGLAPLRFDSPRHMLEAVTLILGSVLIPVAVDYLILICIRVLAARGMDRRVKRIALRIMIFPVLVSGTVNVVAPAPLLVRSLFGVAVVLIPMAEGLRAIIRPDFAAIEKMETEVASQVTQPGNRCQPGCSCGRHKPRRKSRKTRTPKAPVAAQVSPGTVPFEELDADLAR